MKKLKCIVCLFIFILFSGCTIDYEINIDDSIKEQISISDNIENQEFKNQIDVYFLQNQQVLYNQVSDPSYPAVDTNDILYYKKELVDFEDKHILKYNTTFDLENFKYLYSINKCYGNFTVLNNHPYLIITTGNNTCFDNYSSLEKINIIINSKYKIVDSNADEIENETLKWHVSKNNYKDHYVYLKLDLTEIKNENKELPIYIILLIVFGIVLIAGLLVFLLFKFLNNRNNKI